MPDRPHRVHPLDAHDEAQLRGWWEVGHAVALERPVDLWMTWEEARQVVPVGQADLATYLFGVHSPSGDGGDVDRRLVGAGRLDLPQAENTHLGFGELWVAPDARRRGVGTALLEHVEQLVRRAGRGTVLLDVHAPESVAHGRTLLEAHGYQLAGVEISKVADLVETADRWVGLAERAAARLAPYELVWFQGRVPDRYVEDVCLLLSRFLSEIPLGDVDIRPQQWDAARLRRREEQREAQGTGYLMVAARAPSGALVGYTDVSRRETNPRVATINRTLVLPEHRGHRLGLAMKVLLHQQALALFLGVELIATGNADVNVHMNAVNRELGYRPVDHLLEMQKVLSQPGQPAIR